MKTDLNEKVTAPETVSLTLEGSELFVKGPKGEDRRSFANPKVHLSVSGRDLEFQVKGASKREKRMLSTFIAHIKNMLRGVVDPFEYELKICSGHFPMNVSVSGSNFVVKNFLGEKHPRSVAIPSEVKVKINGTQVIVNSASRESAGMVAARIEQMCRITNRDRRIFQDGIYIVKKPSRILN
ncbi:50S ribosomal protein L6 [archaeon]|nr:50S ribosomal protein L6 [archaeon]|tara:strand:- start:4203 stop:4748 length:546 start_codon:yes stop_codon:yes gene_type:complete